MKTIALVFVMCFAFVAQAQIPNASFETWDYYNTWSLDPEGWDTPNGQLIVSVIPDSAAYEGELAMRVTVLPGFEGGVPQSASTLIPMTEFPTTLHFAVKAYLPLSDSSDRVTVRADFIYEDAIVYSEEWGSILTIEDWQEITLSFFPPNLPVTDMYLTVIAGYTEGLFGGSWDTWISVDAMSLDFIDTVEELGCESSVYPNPSPDGIIRITNCGAAYRGTITILDAMGRNVFQCTQCTADALHLSTPGLYFAIVQNNYRHILPIVVE